MARRTRLTEEDVRAKLTNLGTALDVVTEDGTHIQWAYRYAAAVLSHFDPDALRPVGLEARPGEGVDVLLADCLSDGPPNAPWILRGDIRSRALIRLATPEAMLLAQQANLDQVSDATGLAMRKILLGRTPDPQLVEPQDCEAFLKAAEWLGVALPDAKSVSARFRRAHHRQQHQSKLRALLHPGFAGREDELQLLNAFLSFDEHVVPADGADKSTWRLSVIGEGGIGKSSLLARLLLNLYEQSPARVLAYVDFDLPELAAREPLTVLIEIARQQALYASDDDRRGAWEDVRLTWRRQVSHGRRDDAERRWEDAVQSESLTKLSSDSPCVLVCDTFEEVQYTSTTLAQMLLGRIGDLRRIWPGLAVIVAGRARVPEWEAQVLELRDLSQQDAVRFLLGIAAIDERTALATVQQIGGNPLSLRLAAAVLNRQRDRPARQLLLASDGLKTIRLKHEVIQGQLYGRILQHIHDRTVRRLAHPGLIVRRITPEVIREILAVPCGVALEMPSDAERLFDELKREVTLVEASADGALRHRADVRRTMLRLFSQDHRRRRVVQEIHQRAVAYYSRVSDTVSRAEEVYHRLALGQSSRELDARWRDDIAESVRRSIQELPAAAQRYVAKRLALDISPELWEQAELQEWEWVTERSVEELLKGGRQEQAREALDVLGRREQYSPGSRLYALGARANAALGNRDAASKLIRQGLESAVTAGRVEVLTELYQLEADLWTYVDRDRSDAALISAAEVARVLEDDAGHLLALLERVTLATGSSQRDSVVVEALRVWEALPDVMLDRGSALVSKAGAVLGPLHAGVLTRLMRVAQYPFSLLAAWPSNSAIGDRLRRRLATAFEQWEIEWVAGKAEGAQFSHVAALRDSQGPSRWLELMNRIDEAGIQQLSSIASSLQLTTRVAELLAIPEDLEQLQEQPSVEVPRQAQGRAAGVDRAGQKRAARSDTARRHVLVRGSAYGRGIELTSGAQVEVEEVAAKHAGALSRDATVMAVAPVFPVRLTRSEVVERDETTSPQNWALSAIGADMSSYDGAGVTVAIIDSGVDDSSPAFAGVELVQRDFTGTGRGDADGHGTQVAGIVCGRAVAGRSIGVAQGVRKALIAKVAAGDGKSDSSCLVQALTWSVEAGAQVVFMNGHLDFEAYVDELVSIGLPVEFAVSRALDSYNRNIHLFERLGRIVAAREAFLDSAIVVAPSGDDSRRDIERGYEVACRPPAFDSGAIVVGAVSLSAAEYTVAPFSNGGVALCAPGVTVMSARLGGGVCWLTGTSAAAAYVAGVAALWVQRTAIDGPVQSAVIRRELVGRARVDALSGDLDQFVAGAGLVRAPHD